jgi:hypothetical protein
MTSTDNSALPSYLINISGAAYDGITLFAQHILNSNSGGTSHIRLVKAVFEAKGLGVSLALGGAGGALNGSVSNGLAGAVAGTVASFAVGAFLLPASTPVLITGAVGIAAGVVIGSKVESFLNDRGINAGQELSNFWDGLIDALNDAPEKIQKLGEVLRDFGNGLVDPIYYIMDQLGEMFSNAFSNASESTRDALNQALDSTWNWLEDNASGLTEFLDDVSDWFEEKGPTDRLLDVWQDAYDQFQYAAPFTTPLVLDLDGDGIELTSVNGATAFFDVGVDGFAEATGCVAADDGLLVLDVNGNGRIDNGSELFGDQTGHAHGFLALAQHDDNGDGVVDEGPKIVLALEVEGDLIDLQVLRAFDVNVRYEKRPMHLSEHRRFSHHSLRKMNGSHCSFQMKADLMHARVRGAY